MTSLANMMDTSAKVARSSAETAAKEEIVPKPLPADVLFGRDKIMFNHVGNIRFRLLIQARAKEYEFAPQRRVKSSIVYDVVQNVHGYGGRFLKREDGLWKVVGVTEAIQKVGHALRDKKQHDYKMKAKYDEPSDRTSVAAATNKPTVESGCELLLKLGRICDSQIALPSSQQQKESHANAEAAERPNSQQGDRLPLPPKQKKPKGASHPLKKRKHSRRDEEFEDVSASNSGLDDENSAADAILALGARAISSAPAEQVKCTEVPSDHEIEHERDQHPTYGGAPTTRRLHGYPPMPDVGRPRHLGAQPTAQQAAGGMGIQNVPPPPMRRTDPLYIIHQRAQFAHQHRANNEQAGSQGRTLPIPESPRNNLNDHQRFLSSQAQVLLQAQQMNNLKAQQINSIMQAAAAGVMPQMGGFGFPGAHTTMRRNPNGARQHMGDEREASCTPVRPPIIISDKSDDDGQWIFYPIKGPNLKFVSPGWKLALIPIDGKSPPIDLDPSIMQFPEI